MKEEKNRILIKIMKCLCLIAAFCLLIVFVPQVRNFIISFVEKKISRELDHEHWNNTLISLNIAFYGFVLAFYLLTKLWENLLDAKTDIFTYFSNKISKISNEEWMHYIPLFFFTLIICVIHFCLVQGGDDVNYFSHALEGRTFLDFLKDRYNTWSSRLVIETILINCYWLNFGLWRVLDVVVFVVIAESIVSICLNDKKYAAVVYAVILFLTPYFSLCTAGWGATTVNYLWPVAAAMPAFVIEKKIFEKKALSKASVILSLLLLIFATNQEQVAALIFGLNVSFLIFNLLKNRNFQKNNFYFIAVIFICIVSLIFILSCPGNKIRFSKEITTWFPGYSTLSIFEKCQIGLLSILSYYFSLKEMNFIIVPLCIVLTILFYKKSKSNFIMQILLNLFIVFCFALHILKKDFILSNNQLAKFSNHSNVAILFECIILTAVGFCFLYQIYSVMKEKKAGLFNVFLICAGYCSALIVAFSPTVYASGSRCYLFMSFIIFIVTFKIINDYTDKSHNSLEKPSEFNQ